MERKMRRFKQLLTDDRAKEILRDGSHGVLSIIDADGDPYGVPISYAFDGWQSIYFHSARSGRKIDGLRKDSRCSFSVIEQDMIVPEEFTSYFRSIIASGTLVVVNNPDEVLKGLKYLCDKYSPGIDAEQEIARCINRVTVLRMDISNLSGKEAIELVRNKPGS